MKIKIKLIIGLGNPGSQYTLTYHNVGFLAVDYLTKNLINSKLVIIKPKTFMNKSGKAVAEAKKRFKVKSEEILIIHDDSDIELGKYKFSFGRGSAGHKGIESIIKALKTKNFWRLRIGIRSKKVGLSAEARRAKAEDFVLKKITKKDLLIFNEVFSNAKNSNSLF
ncbi:MAG: aminoacyl-tRNA hydrolase [Candidatus Paceibacterota bacterium]